MGEHEQATAMQPIWDLLRSTQNDNECNSNLRSYLKSANAARPWPQTRLKAANLSIHSACAFCPPQMLTQLTHQYREGLISESTKAAMKNSILQGASSGSQGAATASAPAVTTNLNLNLGSPARKPTPAAKPDTVIHAHPKVSPLSRAVKSPTNGGNGGAAAAPDPFDPSQSIEMNGNELSELVNGSTLWGNSPSSSPLAQQLHAVSGLYKSGVISPERKAEMKSSIITQS